MKRLRLNITQVAPGYVTCSLFQSDNGVNWACIGTDVTMPEFWFQRTFGGVLERGRRIEFEITSPHDVVE